MKTKNYYFILSVVAAILCVPTLGEELELSSPEEESLLIGNASPSLARITGLNVTIVPPYTDPNEDGLVWKELEQKIIRKLRKADIAAVVMISGKFSIFSYDAPDLRVCINILKLPDSQKYVFHIQTTLARTVTLPAQQKLHLKTDVWKTEPIMQAVSVKDMPAAVTGVVLEQVDAFIHAYLAANQPGSSVSDVNAVSVTAVTKRAWPAGYKFVASKNSDVFHRPDCSSAKRIKPENLVGYNSRAEALEAGKRPCKRCKP